MGWVDFGHWGFHLSDKQRRCELFTVGLHQIDCKSKISNDVKDDLLL